MMNDRENAFAINSLLTKAKNITVEKTMKIQHPLWRVIPTDPSTYQCFVDQCLQHPDEVVVLLTELKPDILELADLLLDNAVDCITRSGGDKK